MIFFWGNSSVILGNIKPFLPNIATSTGIKQLDGLTQGDGLP